MKKAIVLDPPTPRELAESLDKEADLLSKKAQWSQAVGVLQEALQLKKQIQGAKHSSIATALDRLGTALSHCHLNTEADAAFTESEEILESSYYAGHGYLAPVLEHHADSLIEESKLGEAEEVLKRTLEIYTKTLTMENRDTLRTVYKLALLYIQEQKYTEAQLLLEKTMKHVDTPLGPCAEFRYQLALAYIGLDKIAEASQLLKLAISEFKQRQNYVRVADSLEICSRFEEQGSQKQEALKTQAKAFRENPSIYPKDIFLATLIRT